MVIPRISYGIPHFGMDQRILSLDRDFLARLGLEKEHATQSDFLCRRSHCCIGGCDSYGFHTHLERLSPRQLPVTQPQQHFPEYLIPHRTSFLMSVEERFGWSITSGIRLIRCRRPWGFMRLEQQLGCGRTLAFRFRSTCPTFTTTQENIFLLLAHIRETLGLSVRLELPQVLSYKLQRATGKDGLQHLLPWTTTCL